MTYAMLCPNCPQPLPYPDGFEEKPCHACYVPQFTETFDSLAFASEIVACPHCGHRAPWEPQATAVAVVCVVCAERQWYRSGANWHVRITYRPASRVVPR